ncbi:MAG: hypothetical protein FJW20_05520 [Acidimicrobiia bacterium]|nr:hypothetical protein [Acidimicrobiia bacterium]
MEDLFKPGVDPPRGTAQARCDEKGRLKIPVAFQRFLEAIEEKDVFCTTLDKRTARIYPISVWKRNQKTMHELKANTRAAADVALIANHYGADSQLDGQGRILMPPLLRRELGLENAPVWMEYFRGGFTVYSESLYQEKLVTAQDGLEGKVEILEQGGLL